MDKEAILERLGKAYASLDTLAKWPRVDADAFDLALIRLDKAVSRLPSHILDEVGCHGRLVAKLAEEAVYGPLPDSERNVLAARVHFVDAAIACRNFDPSLLDDPRERLDGLGDEFIAEFHAFDENELDELHGWKGVKPSPEDVEKTAECARHFLRLCEMLPQLANAVGASPKRISSALDEFQRCGCPPDEMITQFWRRLSPSTTLRFRGRERDVITRIEKIVRERLSEGPRP